MDASSVSTPRPDGTTAPARLDAASPSARRRSTTASTSASSRRAPRRVELLLFDGVDDAPPSRVIALDPRRATGPTTTGTSSCPGSRPGQIYGYRARRPVRPGRGAPLRPRKVLLDPYGRARRRAGGATAAMRRAAPGDNAATAMKSVVVDRAAYDWEGDAPPRRPFAQDGHLRDARRRLHPPPQLRGRRRTRGTYAGLIEKIPYLRDLGVTAVELLPVFAVRRAGRPAGHAQLLGLRARSPSSRPHAGYSSRREPARPRSTSSATWSRRCTAPASR